MYRRRIMQYPKWKDEGGGMITSKRKKKNTFYSINRRWNDFEFFKKCWGDIPPHFYH